MKNVSFNLDQFLFVFLIIAFATNNLLINCATILIVLRCTYIFFKDKKSISLFDKIPKTVLVSLLLFFVFATITNFVKISDQAIMLKSFREYKWICVFFFYSYFLLNRFKLKWLYHLNSFYIVVSIVAIYSFVQFFTGLDPIGTHKEVMGGSFPHRSIGFFGMPITFSYLMGALFFLLFPIVYWQGECFKNKKFVTLAMVLMLLTVIATQTRISWIAIFLVFMFLALFYIKRLRVFLLIAILAAPVIYSVSPDRLQDRIKSTLDLRSKGENKGRIYVWRAHFSIFSDNILLGNGISNYKKSVKSYFDQNGIKSRLVAHAHNTFIHMLSSQGILGFIPFMVFYLYFIFILLRRSTSVNSELGLLRLGLLSSLLFLYIGGLTEVLIIDSETIHIMSLLWALVVVTVINENKKVPTNTML